VIILCGHYEGVDQRIIDEIVDEEISIGDFVLTGGEIPACLLVDAVARLVDGVLSDPECHEKESISSGMLEYPQYTRPYEFHGVRVPDILISGNHAKIDSWRSDMAMKITEEMRPDLLENKN
jgi:tRNA (guanine37-N1)-methyltransferase